MTSRSKWRLSDNSLVLFGWPIAGLQFIQPFSVDDHVVRFAPEPPGVPVVVGKTVAPDNEVPINGAMVAKFKVAQCRQWAMEEPSCLFSCGHPNRQKTATLDRRLCVFAKQELTGIPA